MTENLFVKALTAESFEALCDAYKEGMARAFDFQISDKKRNKLRNAVSYMLGFPNGYQQIERTFINAKTEPIGITDLKWTPDSFRKISSNTMIVTYQDPGNTKDTSHLDEHPTGYKQDASCRYASLLQRTEKGQGNNHASADIYGDFIVLLTPLYDPFRVGYGYSDVLTMLSGDIDVQQYGSIGGVVVRSSRLEHDHIESLRASYRVKGAYITHPDADEYDVPEEADPSIAHKVLSETFGLEVCDFNQFKANHFVRDSRDDYIAKISIFLERKPQEHIIEHPRSNARDDDLQSFNTISDALATKTETTEHQDDGFPQYLMLEVEFDVDPWELGDAFVYQMQTREFAFCKDDAAWPHAPLFFLAANPKGLDVDACATLLQKNYLVEGMLVAYPLDNGKLPRAVLPQLAMQEIETRLGLSIGDRDRFIRQHHVTDGNGFARIFMVRK